jgi:hypothetical protein
MGSELMRIAEGFSIVAEGLRGLAKAEGGTKDKAVKAQKQDTTKAQPESVAEVQQKYSRNPLPRWRASVR